MKKILIATTALVATAGMAAAELNLSGAARVGLTYEEGRTDDAGVDAETLIEQRFRFQVQGIAESDAGVKFEVRMRAEAGEDTDGSISGGGFGAAGFAVSTGGFRLDVGNVSDVIDSGDVVNYYGYGVGFTAFLEHNANSVGIPAGGFSSGDQDATTIKLRYSVGDFTAAVSYSQNNKVQIALVEADATAVPPVAAVTAGAAKDIEEYQIGFGYNFGNYSVGVAFGSEDTSSVTTAAGTPVVVTQGASTTNDFWALSFGGSLGAVDFALLVTDSDAADDVTFGASLNYDISATTALRVALSDGGATGSDTAFAIGAVQSLGGGVSLAGGIGQNNAGNTVADLGVNFSF